MKIGFVAAIVISIILMSVLSAESWAQGKKEFKYGGVATCKACHLTKKSGAQYKLWQEGPHAKAYETLLTDAAKEVAKKKGIDNPEKADECLKCHVTAHGVDAALKGPKLTIEEGVSCESCHGPGSGYKSKKVMMEIWKDKAKAADYGLVIPTKEVCVTCHNEESPSYKPFKFEEAVKKIAHPVPKPE